MSFFFSLVFFYFPQQQQQQHPQQGRGPRNLKEPQSRPFFFFFFFSQFISVPERTYDYLYVHFFFFFMHTYVLSFFFNSLLANPPVSFIASNSRFPWHAILCHATQLSAAFFVCSVICLTHHASYIHIFFSLINDHSNS